jgi:N-acetyl-gamma-glutamyl-phosphate reductase
MAEHIRVGLVGVTGYTGMELLRLLAVHPSMVLVRATSRSEHGKTLGELFPNINGFAVADLIVTMPDPKDIAEACDLVFLAVPHGTAMDMAADLHGRGVKVVDLSADFRLDDKDVYAQWYGLEHRHPQLFEQAVYGIPELYREHIKLAKLTANPGCYPTSVILGLTPALRNDLIEPGGIVADSKSGSTGAGRSAKVGTLFCEVSDTFRAYNIGKHRHTPEIEQELGKQAGTELVVSFNPHLLPINRGILSTMYALLKPGVDAEQVQAAYESAYAEEPFVRVLPQGQLPETKNVRGTNFCDIGTVVDRRSGRLVVVSVVDNLCRGASGQAIANANLMCGLPEETGLLLPPLAP